MFLHSLPHVPAKPNQRYHQEHFKGFGEMKLSLSYSGALWVRFQVTSLGSKPCIQALLTCTWKLIKTCIWALQAVSVCTTIHLTTMNNLEIIKLLTKIICCMTSVYGRLICWLHSVACIIIIAVPNPFLHFFLWSIMHILWQITQSCTPYLASYKSLLNPVIE